MFDKKYTVEQAEAMIAAWKKENCVGAEYEMVCAIKSLIINVKGKTDILKLVLKTELDGHGDANETKYQVKCSLGLICDECDQDNRYCDCPKKDNT